MHFQKKANVSWHSITISKEDNYIQKWQKGKIKSSIDKYKESNDVEF